MRFNFIIINFQDGVLLSTKMHYEITYFREIDSIQVKFKFIRIWGSGRQQK